MTTRRHRHLLFLDDDRDFLDTIESAIPPDTRRQWRVFFAQDAARALALLRKHPIDLVVTDLDMPVVDGLQFLQLLHQVCPDPRKVVLSSHSDEQYRQECLQRGAVLFLKKPASLDGFESIFRVLHEILQWQPPRGFSGLLRNVTISDLVQLECISRASSILQITTSTICGRIYIDAGRIAHAETQDKQGEEAFLDLVSLETGAFAVQPYGEPPRRSIDESCDGLLLAAAQRSDERAHESESQASMETDSPLSTLLQKSPNFPDNRASARRSKSTSTCYSGAC